MTTELVKIQNLSLPHEKTAIKKAASILQCGGLVVMPTETVYGLGANATDENAAKKIYAAKGRPSDNPLIIHISEPSEAEKYCFTTPEYYELAKAFMPGPLTVILKKKSIIPDSVTGGLDTVAVRCPSHPIAHELIKELGGPIAAPSANLSGKPSPTNAKHVFEDMNGRVDMIIDGGDCEVGLESTIVKLEKDKTVLLRPGGITFDALCMVCRNVVIAPSVAEKLSENEHPICPGMKYKHYAPETPIVLLDGEDEDVLCFLKKEQNLRKNKCAILCYDEEAPLLNQENLLPIGKKNDISRQAKKLFTLLRDADKLNCDIIYSHLPSREGLGLALYNRMLRAAAHTVKKVQKGE